VPAERIRIESPRVAWSQRERARAAAIRASQVFAALSVIALGMMIALGPDAMSLVFTMALFGLLVSCALVLGLRARRSLGAQGAVVIEGESITLEARDAITRRFDTRELEQGWLEQGDDGVYEARLRLRNGAEATIAVADRGAGDALLRAAGVAAADRAVRMPLRSTAAMNRGGRSFTAFMMLMLTPYVVGSGAGAVALLTAMLHRSTRFAPPAGAVVGIVGLLVITLASFVGLRRLLRHIAPRTAIVGTDGIAIVGDGQRFFVPYAQIAGAARDREGVRLLRHDAPPLFLPTVVDAGVSLPEHQVEASKLDQGSPVQYRRYERDIARREALLSRIEEARAVGRGGGAGLPRVTVEQLDRRGRSVDVWCEALGRLLGGGREESGYRDMALARGPLLDLVEDGAAAPERRVAAAVALSRTGDVQLKQRLRIVAETCADEDMRAALEHAAEGEIEQEALARAARQHMG